MSPVQLKCIHLLVSEFRHSKIVQSPAETYRPIGPFHFISIQGGCKILGLPYKERIPWGRSINLSFPELPLV